MILFNMRKRIADDYETWLWENPEVKDCPMSVIAFVSDLLDEEKVIAKYGKVKKHEKLDH